MVVTCIVEICIELEITIMMMVCADTCIVESHGRWGEQSQAWRSEAWWELFYLTFPI